MRSPASGSGQLFWLASYPKSGNTWMRVLLTNYLRDGTEPADINALDGGPIASARSVFDEYVGVEASDLTQDEIEQLRPAVYEELSKAVELSPPEPSSGPPVLKVHDAFTRTALGVPLISPRATAGAIYLLRNPLDVVESFAHHNATTVERMATQMGDPGYAFVDRTHKLHRQLRQRLLTWSQHVTSWVDDSGLDILTLRYEDMSTNTEDALRDVVSFLGLTPDPTRISKAVRFSTFDQLQAQETSAGFSEKMPLATSFFRRGQVDGWRQSLRTEIIEQICTDHRQVMDRFGYEPDRVIATLKG